MKEELYLWEVKKTVWIKGSQNEFAECFTAPSLAAVLSYLEADIANNSVDVRSINKIVKIDQIL